MAGFGSSIKLTGESEYQRALKQINQSLKEVGSEMKVVSSSFDKNDKSTQAMAQKSEVLNKALEQQQAKLSVLTKKYNEMNATYGKNSTAQKELTAELTKERAKLDEIGNTLGKTSKEYQAQEKVVNQLEDKQVQYNNAVSKAKTEMNQAQAVVNKTTKELDELENELDDNNDELKKNEKGWSSWGQTLADLRTKAITGAINGLKKLGSAVISVGKQAISSYADYEQLVGGVETLFKDSSKTVQKYANQSYKTAGISANEYMQQITSFSASLISSLGGDTKKAAEYGNRAIIDMSDNANKMGTSMDMIQNAYQGFAKQNYTMLDNLKLGYGGTKTEMQRLIADASKMTEVQKELGITVDSSSMSFGNIVNAISVMQKQMGIAGTTAKEASSTIQGSVNSMKSAWQNLLTGLADGNQEMGPLIQNFIDSVATAWENLKPRIRQTIDGIKQAIGELWAKRGEIKEDIPELAPLINAMEWIIDNKELVVGALTAMIGAMAIGKIASFINTMATLGTLLGGIPAVAGLASTAMTVLGGAFTFMTGPIGIAIAAIGAVVGAFVLLWNKSEAFRNFWIGLWEGLKNIVSTAIDTIINVFNTVVDFVKNNWQGLLLMIVNPFAGAFKLLYDNCEGFKNFIDNFIKNIISFFKNLPENIGYIIGQVLGHIIKFGVDAYNWVTTEVPKIINNIIKFFAELPGKIWNLLVTVYNKVNEWGANVRNKAIEIGTNFVNSIINFVKELPGKIWSFLTTAIAKVGEFATNIANKGREGARNLANNVVNGIKSLPSQVMSIGKNIVEGLWNGIKNAGSWITSKVKDFSKGILKGMKSALGIKSPSTLFRDEVGKNIALGLGEGFTDEMKNVSAEMQNAIPTNFDINGGYNGTNGLNGINTLSNYNSLVEAFTEALEGMKIELDDEEVGSFVKRTVETAIYT